MALLTLIPYLAALHGTPPGWYFRGSLRPSTDEGLYLTAVRLGAHGDWLWHDPFAVQTPAPMLIYPTYFLVGHLGALLHLAPRSSFMLYHPLAAALLVVAAWRLAGRCLLPGMRPWLFAFAIGTSGLYWLDALLAATGHDPVSLTRMGMQQLSGFSLGLIVAHEAVGLAGQMLTCTALLDAACSPARHRLAPVIGGAGALLIGLATPVLLPLALMVVASYTLATVARQAPRWATLLRMAPTACAVLIAGGPFVLYYLYVFSHGVWRVFQQLGALNPAEALLTWGVFLPLAVWGWRAAPREARPLADLLALWCLCAVAGTVLNIWQGSRLATGLNLPIGMLIAMGLVRQGAARRRWLTALGLGLICQYLYLLSALLGGHATHLYNSPREEQALRWLGAHAGPRDVVLAPFLFGNVLPEASTARVVAGEYDQTYDFAVRYPQLQTFYSPQSALADRFHVLRDTRTTLVVYDAQKPQEGTFDPRGMPGLQAVFSAGDVAVLRVEK